MHKEGARNILLALLLNIFFSIIEFIGGILTNSISIISDAIHDFGDALAIGIAYVLEKKSSKKPNESYTYGYLRYSTLGALITSIILLVGSIIIIYNATLRLINPVEVHYDGMLFLAIFGIVINGYAAFKTSHSHNANEKAVSLHMFEDVLGWIVVLIGSVLIKITGLYILDPILSILITLFILYKIVKNMKGIFNVFLEKSPRKYSNINIKNLINNKNIIDVHHIHIWSMDSINTCITMHVLIDKNLNLKELSSLKNIIKHKIFNIGINHVTIEFEYNDENCLDIDCNIEKTTYYNH